MPESNNEYHNDSNTENRIWKLKFWETNVFKAVAYTGAAIVVVLILIFVIAPAMTKDNVDSAKDPSNQQNQSLSPTATGPVNPIVHFLGLWVSTPAGLDIKKIAYDPGSNTLVLVNNPPPETCYNCNTTGTHVGCALQPYPNANNPPPYDMWNCLDKTGNVDFNNGCNYGTTGWSSGYTSTSGWLDGNKSEGSALCGPSLGMFSLNINMATGIAENNHGEIGIKTICKFNSNQNPTSFTFERYLLSDGRLLSSVKYVKSNVKLDVNNWTSQGCYHDTGRPIPDLVKSGFKMNQSQCMLYALSKNPDYNVIGLQNNDTECWAGKDSNYGAISKYSDNVDDQSCYGPWINRVWTTNQ